MDTEEQKCRSLYEALGVPAPPPPSEGSGYPTDVLIGCVDMEACWTREEFAGILGSTPNMLQEPNSSNYVFWCVRPRRLAVPVKMGGDNKFWRLPLGLLPAAQRGLQPVRWPAPSEREGLQSLGFPDLPPRAAAAAGRAGALEPLEEDEEEPLLQAAAVPAPAAAAAAAAGSVQSRVRAGTTAASASSVRAKASTGRNGASTASASAFSTAAGFDLWPAAVPGAERLEVLEKDRDADRDVVILQNGFIHLVGFVPKTSSSASSMSCGSRGSRRRALMVRRWPSRASRTRQACFECTSAWAGTTPRPGGRPQKQLLASTGP